MRCARTWMLTAGCLKPDAAAALAYPPGGCLAASGAVLVIQVDTAILVSRAMRPPTHHGQIFLASPFASLADQQRPRRDLKTSAVDGA
jgi:hypothetical protein